MRITTLFVCMCCLVAAPAVLGQAPNTSAKPGILGYLDPQTGAFRPIPQMTADDVELPAVTTLTGTISVTLTITLKTTSLTNVTCIAETVVLDNPTSPVSYTELNTVAATGTGGTRTCKLTIPYSWALATQSSDNMSTSYTVSGSTGTSGLPQRTAGRSPLDTRKVPSTGTTTTLSAAVTI